MKTSMNKTNNAESRDIRKLSTVQGTSVMITSMMGSGVMLLAVAVRNLGYIQGPIAILLVAALAFFTLYAITFSADKYSKANNVRSQEITFYNVSKDAHPRLGDITNLFLILQGMGACICYIIGLKKFVFDLVGQERTKPYEAIFITLISMVLVFISMRKDLSSLRFASYLSVTGVFYLTALVIYFTALAYLNNALTPLSPLKPFEYGYKSSLGDIIFAMGCHQNIVKVFSELQNRNMSTIKKVSGGAIVFGGSVYLINGFLGCLLIRETTGTDTILGYLISKTNRPAFLKIIDGKGIVPNDYLIKLGIVMFCCVLFCAYPMQLHPTRDGIESTFGYHNKVILTLVIAVIAGIIGFLAESISTVSCIIGATAINGITFAIPGAVFLKHCQSAPLRILAYFTILFSIVIMILLLSFTLSDIYSLL